MGFRYSGSQGSRKARSGRAPNEVDADLSSYRMTRAIARNGSPYATFRKEGQPTLTAFGETANRLVEMALAGESARIVLVESGGTARIASVRCPTTGLQIAEDGRMAAVPQSEERSLPMPHAAEPEGFWERLGDRVRGWLGLEESQPESIIVDEQTRSGYPVVDALVARIDRELEVRPDLADENGARFDRMAEAHLYSMAQKHAEAVRDASPEGVRRADAMFSEYLGIVETSLEASVRAARQSEEKAGLDGMATELGFVRARHGVDSRLSVDYPQPDVPAPALPPPSNDVGGGRMIRSMAKGPRVEEGPDAAVVNIAAGRGGSGR